MNAQPFCLKKRPFPPLAVGNNVFVGPQTAATIAGLKKALAAQDAVMALTGPAGVGKSTLGGRAVVAMAAEGTHKGIGIGRMRLGSEDVLEFLLDELGVENKPAGTIRRFAALREGLASLEESGKHLVIVIEDAPALGMETVAEIEALTAADAGPSGGAAIVLMGDERLFAMLQEPALARLAQRVRKKLKIEPLNAAELRGYLMHCFRQAGGEFEAIFDTDSAAILHALSKGIPRVVNTLVEASMAAATDQGLDRVTATFVAAVAHNEFGLEAIAPIPEATVAASDPKPEPVVEPIPLPEAAADPDPSPEPPADEPVLAFADEDDGPLLRDDEIPDLIQDTLPALQTLSSQFLGDPATESPETDVDALPEMESEPEPEPETDLEPLPELEPEAVMDASVETPSEPELEVTRAGSSGDEVPAWERDPTIAELCPDLDALEAAMASDRQDEDDVPAPGSEVAAPAAKSAEASEEIPEITLDNAIRERITNNLIDEPDGVSRNESEVNASSDDNLPELKLPASGGKNADAELDKIASELARAKTIDDVDDRMAETLFGEELNLIAFQFAANAPDHVSANDEVQVATGTPGNVATADGGGLDIALETKPAPGTSGMDLSASQRLMTVRSFGGDHEPTPNYPVPPPNGKPVAESTPEPIEDQINTSMTQTLKALNVRPPISGGRRSRDADDDDDDADEEKKGGFFSRFKRS